MPSVRLNLFAIGVCLLQGCAAVGGAAAGKALDAAFEAAGYTKADPNAVKGPRSVSMQIFASDNLNAASGGRPLALLTRIYKLRDPAAFLQAPYETFANPVKEKEVLGQSLIESKEIMLIPGQQIQSTELIPREAAYFGVIALFHSPAEQRWRFVFSSEELEKSGLTLGVYACAMAVTRGVPQSSVVVNPATLGGTRCR